MGTRCGASILPAIVKRLLKRLLLKTFLYVGLPSLLIAGVYGWWAKSRLEQSLASSNVKSWTLSSFTFVERAESNVDASLSRVLRVVVKRTDGANYRPYNQALVHNVYDWSPGKSQWIEAAPSLEESAESLKLQSLGIQTPGQHVDQLADPNVHIREVASTLLRERTGQDFGYRFDRPPESQKASIEKWRSWWEKNKVSWIVGKTIEATTGILNPSKNAAPGNK